VLEIKVPHLSDHESSEELLSALKEMFPKIVSWAVSFFFISVMWVQHHNVFRMAKSIDYGIIWINNIFLFSISFIPFPTALMGEYPHNQLGVLLFGVNVTFASLMQVWLYQSVAANHLQPQYNKATVMKNVMRSFLLAPLPLIASIGFSFISLWIPYFIYAIVPLFFLLPLDEDPVLAG
jgi:uncharacterized membrane protein